MLNICLLVLAMVMVLNDLWVPLTHIDMNVDEILYPQSNVGFSWVQYIPSSVCIDGWNLMGLHPLPSLYASDNSSATMMNDS